MTSPRINWEKRGDHPLMRSPQPCDVCHRHHLETEPCLVLAKCVQCGGPVGYVYRGEEGHAECRHCIREGEL